MKQKVVFIRNNYTRKPQFIVRTIGVTEGKILAFKKEGLTADSREGHLMRMVKTYQQFDDKNLGQYFCPVQVNRSGELEFRAISGESLEAALLTASLRGHKKEVEKLLNHYESLLLKLSDKNGLIDKELNDIFDGKLILFNSSRVIKPAILDLNFDNIILSPKGLVVIDYEWSFPGCIPLDFVLYRSIMWFGRRYASLFQEVSLRVDMTGMGDRLVLPDFFFKRYPKLSDKLQICLELEDKYFQPYVSRHKLPKYDAVPLEKRSIKHKKVYTIDRLFDAESELQEAIGSQSGLNAVVSSQIETINKLNSDIHSILSSKRYRIGTLIASPLTVLRKFFKK